MEKQFYARLPARTYRKLRRLAQLEPLDVGDNEKVPITFRFHVNTHQRLKRLALRRSLDGTDTTMQSMLAALINRAKAKDLETRADMHDVVRQLIFREEL